MDIYRWEQNKKRREGGGGGKEWEGEEEGKKGTGGLNHPQPQIQTYDS